MTFAGFPARVQATAIPNVFFTDLLPLLRDREEIAVAICVFRALARKRGFPRYLTRHEPEFEAGLRPPLMGGGGRSEVPADFRSTSASSAVERGLRRGVEIGMLLALSVEQDGEDVELYFLNAPADRRGLEAVRSGAVDIGVIPREEGAAAHVRSSIFTLYESLIGTISPLIADELAEAERLYPAEWLEAAFREAASQNARSWRYVSRILERWAIEGPDHATTERSAAGDRYFRGKYGKILKQRLQP